MEFIKKVTTKNNGTSNTSSATVIAGGGGAAGINWDGESGAGNAITAINYDEGTKTLSAVKGQTFLTGDDITGKADKADTLSGYGISDAYTKMETDAQISGKILELYVDDSAVDNQFVTAVSERLGKISVSRATLTAANIAQAGKLSNSISGNADTATKLASITDGLTDADRKVLVLGADGNIYTNPNVTSNFSQGSIKGKKLQVTDGTNTASITINDNGIYVDKPIICQGDVVAYGVTSTEVATVQDMIIDYINEHKGEFGSIDNVVIATATGTGNVITGLSAALSSDKRTITITPTKGVTALTEHQSLTVKRYNFSTASDVSIKQPIYTLSAVNHLNWGNQNSALIDKGALAYWNGRYNDNSSNLLYFKNGEIDSVSARNTAITNAINALDVTDTAVANKFVTAVSETDGKISVTRATLTATNIAQAGKLSNSISGNADTATTLANPRTIWGQSFNGSANVTGALSSVTDITMTGAIKYKGTKQTYDMIKFHDNTEDTYGNGISIGGGGVVIVGAGESASSTFTGASLKGGTESLFLTSDNDIQLLVGQQNGYVSNKGITITSGGNVGIGTASPTQKLDVVGAGKFSASTRYALEVSTSAADTGAIISFNGTNSSEWAHIGCAADGRAYFFNYKAYNNNSHGVTGFGVDANANFFIGSTGVLNLASAKMMVSADGNVGIGTTSPSQKLDVNGNAAVRGAIYVANDANYYAGYIGTASDRMEILAPTDSGTNARPLYLGKRGGTHYMALLNNGNVGIGTDSPQQKLHVSGASRTKYVDFYSKDAETTRAGWVGRGSDANNGLTLYSDNDFINIDSNAEINLKAVHKQVVNIGHNATALQSYAVVGEASANCEVANLNFSVNGYTSLARLQFLKNGNFYMGRNYETTVGNDNAGVRIAPDGALVLASTAAVTGTRNNTIVIRPSGSNTSTNQARFTPEGVTISASSANGLVIKRTVANAGAFVNYFNCNQSNNAWRVGMNSLNSFVWAYSSDGLSSDTGKLTLDTSGNLAVEGYSNIKGRIKTPAATSISAGGGIEVGNNKILSLANNLIFCADQLRFSDTGTNWYYNNWAGLKYDSTNKKIYLGVADGTVFTSNNPGITDGTVQLVNCGLVASGDVTAYSDKRLKSEIKDLEYRGPLDPKEYIKDGKKSIGFIAQEVRELYPELVLGEESDTEYLSLNYGAITAVLAAENKELHKKVESLGERIEKLETLINKLIEDK